jgi:predicted nucleotidyltransferase
LICGKVADYQKIMNKENNNLIMNKELNEHIRKLRELFPYLKEHYRVNSIEIFGSYAKNSQKKGSDLDLLVTFSETPSLLKFVELQNYLSDILQLKVDLVIKDSLKSTLSENILEKVIQI